MIFNIVTYKRKTSIIPTALTVTGSWTNTQIVGSVMDTTGLTFTVTYNNGSTATVTPTKSPSTWTSSGTQTATFTYTENGTTVSTTKTATVVAVALSSIAVSGSWTNTQYTETAVDTTGLTVTATFNNGTMSNVTSLATVSPSTWSSTAGEQTATFSYTYNGVTKTTTKTASVQSQIIPADVHYVGGIVIYVDSTADGTYTFYDSSGTQVYAPTVGDDCTGWTYEVSGASKDKYYVFYNTKYTALSWGGYGTLIGASGTAIGTGKSNTATAIGSIADESGSIWEKTRNARTGKLGGCDDWFVPSRDELTRIGYLAFDYGLSVSAWTSEERTANNAVASRSSPDGSVSGFRSTAKSGKNGLYLVRSF